MTVRVDFGGEGYDIYVSRGSLAKAGEMLNLDRRVLVVTDSGVPARYAETFARQCGRPTVVTVDEGEGSKSLACFERLLRAMLDGAFTRYDCVAAVGGGVVGDLAGFAAASYMRGIDFYNVPTTVLSQIDSSIGGKTAVNLCGVKNIVGAFYRPKAVLIDPDVLDTLSLRQRSAGLAEAVKMALTSDSSLFGLIEDGLPDRDIDEVIVRSIDIKRQIVEKDEKESGLRKLLNFGHTIGHGIESASGGRLYHGECVALGMLPMCSGGVRRRLLSVMEALHLPTAANVDAGAVCEALTHDKKTAGAAVSAVLVDEVGKGYIKSLPITEIADRARAFLNGGFGI